LRDGLRENQARIVFASPRETTEGEVAVLEQIFCEEERVRRYARADDRHDHIVARSLLRLGLSFCFKVDPAEWRFDRDERQKPFVVSPAGLPSFQFSLSHTRDLVALLIARAPQAGLDVEYLQRTNDLPLVAKRVCDAEELRSLDQLDGDEWRNRFFQLWTLKEAYSKARGAGLSLPFEDIAFKIDSHGGISAHFAAELNDDPSAWKFWLRQPTASHIMAVAVKGTAHLDMRKVRVAAVDGKSRLEPA
jgi:4'-phosphopantetheinyl transferase